MCGMDPDANAREQAEVKAWLRRLLKESGHSKAGLARDLGVVPRTIANAFSDAAESLPGGLTFYRLLRELGALSPEAPGTSGTTYARLDELRSEVAATRLLVAESVQLQAHALGLDARALELEAEIAQLRADQALPADGTDG